MWAGYNGLMINVDTDRMARELILMLATMMSLDVTLKLTQEANHRTGLLAVEIDEQSVKITQLLKRTGKKCETVMT